MNTFASVAVLATVTQAVYTPYISGLITSTRQTKYGKYVARVMTSEAKGSVFGFFSQWTGPNWDYTRWNSVEMEVVPSLENPLSLDLSYGDGNDRLQSMSDNAYELGNTWRVQEFTWTPKGVTFTVDGVLLKSFAADDPYVINQTKDQNVLFNMWAPRSDAHEEDWSVGRDDTTMPWFAKVDYFEYYEYVESDDSFKLNWRDDFNTIDSNDWTIADDNSTFDQSLSTFVKSQAYVD